MLYLNPLYSILPIIIGHRGIKEFSPENTISSVFIAKSKGINFIEIDTMLTKDLYPIVHHDSNTQRCSDTNLIITETYLDELRKYDFGKYYSKSFEKEKIARLKDMIIICNILDIILNIEIKSNENDLITPINVCEEIKLYGNPNNIIISSFSISSLEIAKKILPEYKRCYIVKEIPDNYHKILNNVGSKTLVFSHEENSNDKIKKYIKKDKNNIFFCYTVNDINKAIELISYGVSGIITDKPYSIKKKLNEYNINNI